jgi:predicted PurR-regulated permease PerM
MKSEPEEPGTPMPHEDRRGLGSSASQVAPRTVVVVILTAAAVLSVLYLLWQLREVVVWCVIALFVAVALNPAVNWLQRRGIKRIIAILLTYFGLLLGVMGIGVLVVPLLFTQIEALVNFGVAVSQNPEQWLGYLRDFANQLSLGWLFDAVVTQLQEVPAQLGQWTKSFLLSTGGFLISAAGFVVALITILVVSFFLLLEGERFVNLGLQLFPEPQRPHLQRILRQGAEAVSGYVTGNLTISLICGVAIYVVLLVLGMPYAVVLALIVAVLDLIPQIGAPVGGGLLVVVGLLIDPWKSLILLVYFVIYKVVEDNILTPLVYSRSVQLHPLVIFLAVLAGGLLYGILGALLAIPAAEVIRILGAEWLAARTHQSREPSA